MAVESKSFAVAAGQAIPSVEVRVRTVGMSLRWRRRLTWTEVIIAFLFVECAVWAARLSVRSRWAVAASVLVVLIALADGASVRRLGLGVPKERGTAVV